MKKIFTCVFVITVFCLNVKSNKSEDTGVNGDLDEYSISNIECLQSSATEYICSGTTGKCKLPHFDERNGNLTVYE